MSETWEHWLSLQQQTTNTAWHNRQPRDSTLHSRFVNSWHSLSYRATRLERPISNLLAGKSHDWWWRGGEQGRKGRDEDRLNHLHLPSVLRHQSVNIPEVGVGRIHICWKMGSVLTKTSSLGIVGSVGTENITCIWVPWYMHSLKMCENYCEISIAIWKKWEFQGMQTQFKLAIPPSPTLYQLNAA